MAAKVGVNVGSGNEWLAAWQHQGITNVNWLSMRFWDIHQEEISQEMLKIFILNMSLKITELRLQPYLARANKSI